MLHWSLRVVVRKAVRLFTGFALVLIGIVGLILPIMPGWVFLIPGLLILSEYFPPIKRLVEWARRQAARASRRSNSPPDE